MYFSSVVTRISTKAQTNVVLSLLSTDFGSYVRPLYLTLKLGGWSSSSNWMAEGYIKYTVLQ